MARIEVTRIFDGQPMQTVFMGKAEARFWESVDGWLTESLPALQVAAKSRRLTSYGKKLDLAKSIVAHDMILHGMDIGDWETAAQIAKATEGSFLDSVKLSYVGMK